MAAEALDLLVRVNLALGAGVLVVLALRGLMRAWFGARVAYGVWWIAPVAVAAAMLPARIVEIGMPAIEPRAVGAGAAGVARAPDAPAQAAVSLDVTTLLAGGWLLGVVAMLAVLAVRQRAFMASLGRLSRDVGGVVRAEASGIGPAVVGALWPKLVLPKDFEARFDAAERDLVLAHERVHLKGGDARINGLVALAQCVCWFNPLVHVAAHFMRIDQELACDAAVAAQYPRARRAYAEAMLKTQVAPLSLPIGCYWPARGKHPLKLRIAMLKRGLPGRRRVAAGAVLAVLAGLTTGCVVWVGQPPREVAARIDPASPAQAALDAKLSRAVLQGNFQRAQAALAAGADVNARTGSGQTALTVAARTEDMRILNLLLDHGADVNLTSPGEGNALVAGARRGHVYAVASLVEHGADVNAMGPGYGTPLAASAQRGQFEAVKYLVEHGADMNVASPLPAPWDHWGVMRTPLEFAIGGDHAAIVDYLKSKGARM
jgi:beta-lactamase regulating signal transducer with metallopeptidase domain